MKITLPNREYLEIKMSLRSDAVTLTTKTLWAEGSFALSSVDLKEDDVDSVITELIKLKSKILNTNTKPNENKL